jgi:hypothetical protein
VAALRRLAVCGLAGAIAAGAWLSAQQLPSEPPRQFGASITGAFEGWFTSPDGSRSFLLGYFNRNTNQALDIPIGPDNRIEPGGPDLGQPTHFLPGRRWGMFVVPVPKNFTATDRLIWTITANGQTNTIPLRLHPDYVISPFGEISVGNTPPVLQFSENGPSTQGPVASIAGAPARTATVATPLALTLWAADDMKYTSGTGAPQRNPPPPVRLVWSMFRGPGAVTFEPANPVVEKITGGRAAFSGKSTMTARFSAPGEYVLHVTALDYSGEGGGGFQCCWSTAMVKVAVAP